MNKSLICFVCLTLMGLSSCYAQTSFSVSGETPVRTTVENSVFETRLLSFDVNQDGLLQKSELPSSSHGNFTAWDKDHDGVLNKQEQEVLIYFQKNGELPPGASRSNQDQSKAISDADSRLDTGLTVGEFVGRAYSFDRNKDGNLDKVEIIKMAEAFVRTERRNRAADRLTRSNPSSARRNSRTVNQSSSLRRYSGLHSQVRLPSIRSGSQTRSSGST